MSESALPRLECGPQLVGKRAEPLGRSSVCALVVLDHSAAERPVTPEAPPVEGPPERIAAALRDFAEAGADEVILVVSPITERSIRELGEAVALV